jgi:ribonuclease BN (tRNA processing enzyme)
VKHLVLSHIAPLVEQGMPQVIASIRNVYAGPLTVAEDKMRMAVE